MICTIRCRAHNAACHMSKLSSEGSRGCLLFHSVLQYRSLRRARWGTGFGCCNNKCCVAASLLCLLALCALWAPVYLKLELLRFRWLPPLQARLARLRACATRPAAPKAGAARTRGGTLAGGATRIRGASGSERPRAAMSSPASLPEEIHKKREFGAQPQCLFARSPRAQHLVTYYT